MRQRGKRLTGLLFKKAPENKFATAHVDCYRAYKWLKENAASLGVIRPEWRLSRKTALRASIQQPEKKVKGPFAYSAGYFLTISFYVGSFYYTLILTVQHDRMKAAVFHKIGDIRVETIEDPKIEQKRDADPFNRVVLIN